MSIAANKIVYNIDRFKQHKPITADVFLTNYCNNHCPYCTYGRWDLPNKEAYMSFKKFVEYAERMLCLGVRGIILTGGGEPTINPDFLKIAKWLEEKGISYGINTNFNELLYFSPTYLKVSLDAYDEDSYQLKRGVRAYDKVIGNIRKYLEWKIINSAKTKVGIQCVAETEEETFKFYESNKRLNVDYIVFRPVESTFGKYYRNNQKVETAQKIKSLVTELNKKDKRVVLNFKWNMLDWQEEKCEAQWSQIAINEIGEVMYCCHKPYEIIGHIMDDDILQKKEDAKTNMSMCDIPCRLTAPNNFVANYYMHKSEEDLVFI